MRAVVLSSDALFREGLQCLLSGLPWCVSVSAFSSFEPLAAHLEDEAIDAVLATVDQLGIGDLAALDAAKRKFGFRVVGIADADSLSSPMNQITDVVVNRSGGFEALRNALRSLDSPRPAKMEVRELAALYGIPRQLTQREREVARLVSQGMPNRRIATVLGIQEQSVKNLVSVVMRKLDCENRVQVALHLSAPSH